MRRVRQHVNPLKSDLLEIEVARIVVPAGKRLEVELGSGEAHFLIERARVEPDTVFVGVEIRREVVWRANRACEAARITNVDSIFANMSVDLPRLFAPGSVSRFFLNFPDPWFKSRQHKRRVVSPLLIADVSAALGPGGEMFVETDIFDIALEAMATLEGHAAECRFENALAPWSFLPQNPYGARSRRERQCEAEGTPIWRLLYRRV
ncbi:MAG TPA: tRNA (guanosine(46)-N7)-methyltransferase TrmB [Polyangia bacterium]|nr:tRNA (guanosine(46)-N7)-methyltransferase TrmB [Polyangia bacterium]